MVNSTISVIIEIEKLYINFRTDLPP